MCGIAGIVAAQAKQHNQALHQMVQSIHHRGPDARGTHFFNQCGLGHTRLSIVDLKTGAQPMLNSQKNLGITFNGEIYGYQEIRKSLDPYPFQSHSDTEVILALYEKYQTQMLGHLPGMFAFAIWDEANQLLFAARDRFGEKPFYYAINPQGILIFASEIKSILASGLIEPELSRESLGHYLQHLYVHPHTTIYKNIHVLPPAHALVYKNRTLIIKPYWELPATQEKITMNDAVEKFKFLFEQSIKKQLIADVPVGAFLSGGLDSSTVVAVASQFSKNLKTISYGFKGQTNELPFAKQIAQRYQTEHVELSDDQFNLGQLLVEMQGIYDEPFADSSNIPTYLVSKQARQHRKVILTGDGGDELLAGYDFWYKDLWNLEQIFKGSLKKENFALSPFQRFWLKRNLTAHHKHRLRMHDMASKFNDIQTAHLSQNIFFTHQELNKLGNFEWGTLPPGPTFKTSNTVDDALRMDLNDYMPGDILVKTDRASMANSLELRCPFLDVDLATFCISLPSNLKINESQTKMILRQAYQDRLPPEFWNRPKQGFGAPVGQWMKRPEFKALKNDLAKNPNKKIYQLLDYKKLQKYIFADTYQTWIILALSLWLDRHSVKIS